MLFLVFRIKNPFAAKQFEQIDYISYDKKLTKNKNFEVQFTRWPVNTIFAFDIDTCWIGFDHAGAGLSIELLGYYFNIKIYDNRHWDYEKHCWKTYDES